MNTRTREKMVEIAEQTGAAANFETDREGAESIYLTLDRVPMFYLGLEWFPHVNAENRRLRTTLAGPVPLTLSQQWRDKYLGLVLAKGVSSGGRPPHSELGPNDEPTIWMHAIRDENLERGKSSWDITVELIGDLVAYGLVDTFESCRWTTSVQRVISRILRMDGKVVVSEGTQELLYQVLPVGFRMFAHRLLATGSRRCLLHKAGMELVFRMEDESLVAVVEGPPEVLDRFANEVARIRMIIQLEVMSPQT